MHGFMAPEGGRNRERNRHIPPLCFAIRLRVGRGGNLRDTMVHPLPWRPPYPDAVNGCPLILEVDDISSISDQGLQVLCVILAGVSEPLPQCVVVGGVKCEVMVASYYHLRGEYVGEKEERM